MRDAAAGSSAQAAVIESQGGETMTAGTAETQLVTINSKDGTPIGLWKTGSGPSLLAVHGTAADDTAWDTVVPLLASTFAVYAMDRRARGASGDADGYS